MGGLLLQVPWAKKKGVALGTPLRAQIQNFAEELHRKARALHTVRLGTLAHWTGPPSSDFLEHHKNSPYIAFRQVPR